jgi:hypothetical protein
MNTLVLGVRGQGRGVVDTDGQKLDRFDRTQSRQKVTVLVSSAGRRVGLLSLFRESGDKLGLDLRVLSSDMDPELSSASRLALVQVPSFVLPRTSPASRSNT